MRYQNKNKMEFDERLEIGLKEEQRIIQIFLNNSINCISTKELFGNYWTRKLDKIHGDILVKDKYWIDVKCSSISLDCVLSFMGDFFIVTNQSTFVNDFLVFTHKDIFNIYNKKERTDFEYLDSARENGRLKKYISIGNIGYKYEQLKKIPHLNGQEFLNLLI